jgi:hypothetical protein
MINFGVKKMSTLNVLSIEHATSFDSYAQARVGSKVLFFNNDSNEIQVGIYLQTQMFWDKYNQKITWCVLVLEGKDAGCLFSPMGPAIDVTNLVRIGVDAYSRLVVLAEKESAFKEYRGNIYKRARKYIENDPEYWVYVERSDKSGVSHSAYICLHPRKLGEVKADRGTGLVRLGKVAVMPCFDLSASTRDEEFIGPVG